MTYKIIILIILILLSGFFSSAETALFSLNKLKVRFLVRTKNKRAKIIEKIKKDSQKLLTTILIGNNLVNVAASALATSIIFQFTKSYVVGITTGLMTLIILVFGEITPKSLAIKYNERIALIVARPLEIMEWVFYPIIYPFDKLNKFLISA